MMGTAVVALVAVVFLGIAFWLFRSARARRQWPTVQGIVTGGQVRQKSSGVGEDESVMFTPVVEYRYQVGSAAFTASGVGFPETSYGSPAMARKVLARYPVGSAVHVHYNPAKPSEAFLESSGILAWIMLGVGLVLFAVAVVLGIFGM